MNFSDDAVRLITDFEGCALTSYQDSAGIWTIGYGHTGGVEPGQVITKAAADTILRQDMAAFEQGLNELLDEANVKLTQYQFDALMVFVFNVGLGAFKGSTLFKKLKAQDFEGAAKEFLKWDKATVEGKKVTLPGLTKRRAAEASWFLGES